MRQGRSQPGTANVRRLRDKIVQCVTGSLLRKEGERMIRLNIPAIPPSPNRVLGKHWSMKAGVRDMWSLLVRSQYVPSSDFVAHGKRKVKITLCHARLYDKDNAYASVKPVVDALAHWGLICGDSQHWLELAVEQEKCPHKKRHTIIEVETVER